MTIRAGSEAYQGALTAKRLVDSAAAGGISGARELQIFWRSATRGRVARAAVMPATMPQARLIMNRKPQTTTHKPQTNDNKPHLIPVWLFFSSRVSAYGRGILNFQPKTIREPSRCIRSGGESIRERSGRI